MPQPLNEHLLLRLVVGHEQVADASSADEMADFFGEVLGVVAGALQRLRHEDDLQAGAALDVLWILDVAHEDQITEPVHLRISTQHLDRFFHIAVRKRIADIGEHFFEDRRHVGQIAGVLRIDVRPGSLRAGGETEQQVADAFEADHQFHAGEKLARFFGRGMSDDAGDIRVDLKVDAVEVFFALTNVIEPLHGACSNTFRRDGRSLTRKFTGFNGALYEFGGAWLRGRCFHAGRAHKRHSIQFRRVVQTSGINLDPKYTCENHRTRANAKG